MNDKTVVITGAASGIGRVMALELAAKGAHVVAVARSLERAQPVVDEIKTRGGKAEAAGMDVASMASVRAGAAALAKSHPTIHALVNNAGVWAGKRGVTSDGFENTWAINTLAPFLLTELLREQATLARVVNISSVQHEKGSIHWDDLQLESGYSPVKAYRQSKLALVMNTLELAARAPNVAAAAVHPGVAGTGLFKNFPAFIRFWINLLMSTPEKIARQPIALTADACPTGKYFHMQREKAPHALARDEAARKRLWEVVSKQTRLTA
jgi:NAD(P)-dependent dehydrogenase (short-subunit alcohol dehydrogenase family)